jgi:hypothetical protein
VPFLGWLLKKSATQSEAIFNVFKSVWPDLYRYVSQELQPKMEVGSLLTKYLNILVYLDVHDFFAMLPIAFME